MVLNFIYFRIHIIVEKKTFCESCEKSFYYKLKEDLCNECLYKKYYSAKSYGLDHTFKEHLYQKSNHRKLKIDQYFGENFNDMGE